jgi:hypothetical protein
VTGRAARERDHRTGRRRQDPDNGRPVRRDEGGRGRLVHPRGRRLDAAIEVAARVPAARDGIPSNPRAWLGRALAELLPDELGDQDRSRWNTGQITVGRVELDRALAAGGRGPQPAGAGGDSIPEGD